MPKNAVFKSTIWVSAIAVLIKFLGLVKQSVLAAYCGATEETDMFFIASGVLISLCTMVFSALSISLLTLHTDKLVNEGRTASNDLINQVLRVFLPVSAAITILTILISPWFAKFLAPGYSHEQIAVMAQYIRLMAVIFVLWCYFLTVNVVLETDKRFLQGRCQGLFQNIFLIIAAIFVYSRSGITSLLWAFILSGLAECILVTWSARHRFHFIFGKLHTPLTDISRLLKLSLPLIVGSAVYEVNDIVDKQISSTLGTGCASYLTYGSTINEMVSGVIVMAMSTVLFSHFATWVSEGNIQKLEDSLIKNLKALSFIIFPIMALCIFAGRDIVSIFYARGSFGETEVHHTYWVAVGYAFGFLFSSVRAVLVRVFYAFKDTRRPMINGIISVMLNIVLSITLSRFLGVWGISFATSIAMLFSVVYMHWQVKTHLSSFSLLKQKRILMKGLLSFVAASLALIATQRLMGIDNLYLGFLVKSFACVIIYVLSLRLMKSM